MIGSHGAPAVYHRFGCTLEGLNGLACQTPIEVADVGDAEVRAIGAGDTFFLWYDAAGLELWRVGDRKGVVVAASEVGKRAREGGELLRACGAREGRRVLDAMAGLGVDGLTLALRGCTVTCIERDPYACLLLADLARRCDLGELDVVCADAYDELAMRDPVDVVYLDPMFPVRGKTAQPGKRLQYLAELVEPDPRPLENWLERAGRLALERVVLKRRLQDPVIARPDWQIRGRTVRYDVYRAALVD